MIKNNIEATTYATYSNTIKNNIIPYFKDKLYTIINLEENPDYIQKYYKYELDRGLKTNTVIRRHALIRKSLQYAFKVGMINSNPADKIDRPKKNAYIASYYNHSQLENLFEIAKGDPLELAIIVAAFYGLRRSEIIGLKWDAIDFKNKTITIKYTVTSVNLNGKKIIVEKERTKSKSSRRTLPLVPAFEEILIKTLKAQKENLKLCGSSYCKDYLDFIFVNKIGERMKPDYITDHFSLLLKKCGLPKIRFHDLRHSCASLLYANGVSLRDIQEWLGHSTVVTTSTIYTHLEYNNKLESANAIA
jgi:integrase